MQDYHRVIVGYHGCDRRVVERVLLEGQHLKPSRNQWDWLGQGIYFWEFGPKRALEFAQEQCRRGKLKEPSVLGAYIQLGRCFDLTDTEHTTQLTAAFPRWLRFMQHTQQEIPENRYVPRMSAGDLLLRHRDCALLNWYMDVLDVEQSMPYYYQTVRGVFIEGQPAYDGAGIMTKTHVQIAVRDRSCILGYFQPTYFFADEEADDEAIQ